MKKQPTFPDAQWTELYALAIESRSHAYAPYSGYQVGAGILLENGKHIGGCNVENSSYGATICAERVAIQAAVAQYGAHPKKTSTKPKNTVKKAAATDRPLVKRVVVVTDATPAWPPCGMCRQVLSEFASPDTPILTANLEGQFKIYSLAQLLPEAFTPGYLQPARKTKK